MKTAQDHLFLVSMFYFISILLFLSFVTIISFDLFVEDNLVSWNQSIIQVKIVFCSGEETDVVGSFSPTPNFPQWSHFTKGTLRENSVLTPRRSSLAGSRHHTVAGLFH